MYGVMGFRHCSDSIVTKHHSLVNLALNVGFAWQVEAFTKKLVQ